MRPRFSGGGCGCCARCRVLDSTRQRVGESMNCSMYCSRFAVAGQGEARMAREAERSSCSRAHVVRQQGDRVTGQSDRATSRPCCELENGNGIDTQEATRSKTGFLGYEREIRRRRTAVVRGRITEEKRPMKSQCSKTRRRADPEQSRFRTLGTLLSRHQG